MPLHHTIVISKETKEFLDRQKIIPRETYNDVISRMASSIEMLGGLLK
jgi:hypothetical protein